MAGPVRSGSLAFPSMSRSGPQSRSGSEPLGEKVSSSNIVKYDTLNDCIQFAFLASEVDPSRLDYLPFDIDSAKLSLSWIQIDPNSSPAETIQKLTFSPIAVESSSSWPPVKGTKPTAPYSLIEDERTITMDSFNRDRTGTGAESLPYEILWLINNNVIEVRNNG